MRVFPNRNEMVKSIIKPEMSVVEIGVLAGDFAVVLASCNPKELYLVDTFESTFSGDQDGLNIRPYSGVANLIHVRERFAGHQVPVFVVPSTSTRWLQACSADRFDFIYIDTTHQYEHTKEELRLADACLKSGGFLCGHDFAPNDDFPGASCGDGVERAVTEFLATNKQYRWYALGMDGCISFALRKLPV